MYTFINMYIHFLLLIIEYLIFYPIILVLGRGGNNKILILILILIVYINLKNQKSYIIVPA